MIDSINRLENIDTIALAQSLDIKLYTSINAFAKDNSDDSDEIESSTSTIKSKAESSTNSKYAKRFAKKDSKIETPKRAKARARVAKILLSKIENSIIESKRAKRLKRKAEHKSYMKQYHIFLHEFNIGQRNKKYAIDSAKYSVIDKHDKQKDRLERKILKKEHEMRLLRWELEKLNNDYKELCKKLNSTFESEVKELQTPILNEPIEIPSYLKLTKEQMEAILKSKGINEKIYIENTYDRNCDSNRQRKGIKAESSKDTKPKDLLSFCEAS